MIHICNTIRDVIHFTFLLYIYYIPYTISYILYPLLISPITFILPSSMSHQYQTAMLLLYSLVQPYTVLYSPIQPYTALYSPIQSYTALYSPIHPPHIIITMPYTIYVNTRKLTVVLSIRPLTPSFAAGPCYRLLSIGSGRWCRCRCRCR